MKRETRTEGRIGKGRGGAVWVHEKVSELEGMYKVCPVWVSEIRVGADIPRNV